MKIGQICIGAASLSKVIVVKHLQTSMYFHSRYYADSFNTHRGSIQIEYIRCSGYYTKVRE